MTENEENEENVKHEVMEPPYDVMKDLKQYCMENEFGLSIFGGHSYCVIIMGTGERAPEETHILAAYNLLDVVITGKLTAMNEAQKQEEIDESEKVN